MAADGTTKPDGTYAAAAPTNTAPPPMSVYAVPPSPVLVSQAIGPDPCVSALALLWCFILPPVAVALAGGDLTMILFNVLFTLMGWMPGVIHAMCTIGLLSDMRAAQAQAAAQAGMYAAGYAAGTAGGDAGAPGGAPGGGGPSPYPSPSPASYGWYAPSPPGPVLGSPVLVAPPAYQPAPTVAVDGAGVGAAATPAPAPAAAAAAAPAAAPASAAATTKK